MSESPFLCRIGRAPDPLDFAPHEFCGKGRFDDPLLSSGHPGPYFRTLYCGTSWLTCYLEVLQGFRPDHAYLARIASLPEGDDDPTLPDAEDVYRDAHLVSVAWLAQKAKQLVEIDPDSRWRSLASLDARESLRVEMVDELFELGVNDFDLSTVTSTNRPMTQAVARFLYEEMGEGGALRYTSRFGCEYTCVALFEGARFRHADAPQAIQPDDPDLAEALFLFELALHM